MLAVFPFFPMEFKTNKEELVAFSICSSKAELDANHPAIILATSKEIINMLGSWVSDGDGRYGFDSQVSVICRKGCFEMTKW